MKSVSGTIFVVTIVVAIALIAGAFYMGKNNK